MQDVRALGGQVLGARGTHEVHAFEGIKVKGNNMGKTVESLLNWA